MWDDRPYLDARHLSSHSVMVSANPRHTSAPQLLILMNGKLEQRMSEGHLATANCRLGERTMVENKDITHGHWAPTHRSHRSLSALLWTNWFLSLFSSPSARFPGACTDDDAKLVFFYNKVRVKRMTLTLSLTTRARTTMFRLNKEYRESEGVPRTTVRIL